MIVTTDSFMETQTPSAFSSKSILFKIKDGPLSFLYSKYQSTRNLLPIQPQNMPFFSSLISQVKLSWRWNHTQPDVESFSLFAPRYTGNAMQQSQFYKIMARDSLSRTHTEIRFCTEREKFYRLNVCLYTFQFLTHHEDLSGFSGHYSVCSIFPISTNEKIKLDPSSLSA